MKYVCIGFILLSGVLLILDLTVDPIKWFYAGLNGFNIALWAYCLRGYTARTRSY